MVKINSTSAVHDDLLGSLQPNFESGFALTMDLSALPTTVPFVTTIQEIQRLGPSSMTVVVTYGAGDMTTFSLSQGQSQTLPRAVSPTDMTTVTIASSGGQITVGSNNPATGIINLTAVVN